ncbi:MAG: hypothetical protein ACU85E_10510 [Gammaproteobacteria bacterium]
MKTTALLNQIGVAIALTFLAAINQTLLAPFAFDQLGAKLNLSLIVLLYLGYLNLQYRVPAGRIVLMVVNLAIVLLCLLIEIRLNTLSWLFPAMIWFNRSILRYTGVLVVLADLSLCLLGTAAIVWTLGNDHSLIAAIWCFLLLQALHVMIQADNKCSCDPSSSVDFNRALEYAESALQRLLRRDQKPSANNTR